MGTCWYLFEVLWAWLFVGTHQHESSARLDCEGMRYVHFVRGPLTKVKSHVMQLGHGYVWEDRHSLFCRPRHGVTARRRYGKGGVVHALGRCSSVFGGKGMIKARAAGAKGAVGDGEGATVVWENGAIAEPSAARPVLGSGARRVYWRRVGQGETWCRSGKRDRIGGGLGKSRIWPGRTGAGWWACWGAQFFNQKARFLESLSLAFSSCGVEESPPPPAQSKAPW